MPSAVARLSRENVSMFLAGAHLPENIGSDPSDLILVELKKPAAK
jgi:hypothetical protein